MKVIHYLHELKFSGAEIMYVDAAPVFQKLGCELSVVNTANHLGEYAPFFEKPDIKYSTGPILKDIVNVGNTIVIQSNFSKKENTM